MNGQLNKDEKLAFETHLCDCKNCLTKLVESRQLIQDPTIDTHIEPVSLPDISKITRWLAEQIKGIFKWRPIPDFYGMGIPALQPIESRKFRNEQELRNSSNEQQNDLIKMPTSALIKVDHKEFPTRIWIEKKEKAVDFWIQVRSKKSSNKVYYVTLVGKNEYSSNIRKDSVIFNGIPYGKYIVQIETMDREVNIVELVIDDQEVKSINI